MKEVLGGLYASPPEPLPFGPQLEARAFLLRRPRGNLLVYRAATVEGEREALVGLGGVSRQYLNHRHEAAPVCDWVAETFDAPVHCHEADAPGVREICAVGEKFAERHLLDEDFEIVPVPGHTPGATAYLCDTGEHRLLFTGDTLQPRSEGWIAVVLGGADRDRYVESLEQIRVLDFDVVVPWVASAGHPFYVPVDRAEIERQLDAVLARVRRGESH
jgi:hypothetical protein